MSRLVAGLVAILAALGAAVLAWHHPVSPLLMLLSAGLATLAASVTPARWPLGLLPLLPLVGFMPWTGWLVVEELDILLLAVAAGGYTRWALLPHLAVDPQRSRRPGLALWCLAPLVASTLLSGWLGVQDAGGLSWGWWQGYLEPLNSLRLAKPMVLTLLLLPLWLHWLRVQPAVSAESLQFGMVGLLAAVALSVWWERWAYTGLLDFSTDYRATGLFWEMHVGGAALDAALVTAFPFAVLSLLHAGHAAPERLQPAGRHANLVWLGCVAALCLGAYAALTTFSRVVYLGVPVALLATVGLAWRQRLVRMPTGAATTARTTAHSFAVTPARAHGPSRAVSSALWLVFFYVFAAWLFPAGGYRSMLALLGAVALLLALADLVRSLPARGWGLGLLGGCAAAVGVILATAWVPKGAYITYTLAWLAAAALVVTVRRGRVAPGAPLVAAFVAVLAGLVAVGVFWGGPSAWAPGLAAAMALALVLMVAAARRRPVWPGAWRWQAQTLALLAMALVVVGVFSGGVYMGQRLMQTGDDSSGRQQHWRLALSWLSGSEWLLGKGLGRFAASHALSGRLQDQVGDERLAPGDAAHGQVLVLTGGKHTLGHGELFRVAQRIPVPAPGPVRLTLQIRDEQGTGVHVEVCEKHLLYPLACVIQDKVVQRPGPDWQTMQLELKGDALLGGSWLAPRWTVFAIAVDTQGRRIELDDLDLRDAHGRALLVNGNFEAGMARWFTSSDRHHMPWHAKNVAVHLLFEQGLFGLLAAALAGGVALQRVSFGAAQGHALAPALAGALVGVALVGVGDSLLDMPRIAWCIWWLTAVALSLPASGRRMGVAP